MEISVVIPALNVACVIETRLVALTEAVAGGEAMATGRC